MKLLVVLLFLAIDLHARELSEDGIFSGRVSKIHPDTGLIRIKVEFENQKYLNKNDSIEFLRGLPSKSHVKVL